MINYNKGTVKQKRYTDIYYLKTPAVKVVQRPKCPLTFILMKADPHTYNFASIWRMATFAE